MSSSSGTWLNTTSQYLAVYLLLVIAAIVVGAEFLLPVFFLGHSFCLAKGNQTRSIKLSESFGLRVDYQHLVLALIILGVVPVVLFGSQIGAAVAGIIGEGYPYDIYRSALKEVLISNQVDDVANTVATTLLMANILGFLVLPILEHFEAINLSSSGTRFFDTLLTSNKTALIFSTFYIAYFVQWLSGSGVLFAGFYFQHHDIVWAVSAVHFSTTVCLVLVCLCAARGLSIRLAAR